MVIVDGDSGEVGVCLFWADFADNFGVRDFFVTFRGNVMIFIYMDGFCAFYLLFGAIWTGAYTLAAMAKFVGI